MAEVTLRVRSAFRHPLRVPGPGSPLTALEGGGSAMRFIDTHLHLWDRDRFEYAWLREEGALPHRFLPTDLAG
ncbi:MAG: hypothetical protein M3N46_08945, partial [Actinomycetota bacterium]|nr:hypothetical protein [Actinomycetota bacterium]